MKNFYKILFLLLTFINSLFADLDKVTIQLEWKHQFEFAGFYTAIEKGYYKDVGLNVQIREYEDGINITNDVIDEKATFGISSSSLILEKLKNKPVVLVASYFKQNALALLTKPNIKIPSDLKDKKIMALNSEMGNTSLGVMLKDYGITKNDYTLINHDFKIDKFINGEIDAMSIFITSQPYELDRLGISYNILNPANFGIYSYDVELFTSEKYLSKHPKRVKDFVEATNKGWEYAFKNKEEIVNLIYEKYSNRKTKEALLYESLQTEIIFKNNIFKIGAIAPELIKLNADMYVNLGLVDKNLNINEILDSYYIKDTKNISTYFTKDEKNFLEKKPTLKVHNELNWPPFNYNTNNIPKGFSIDYMNLLAEKIGLNIEYISGFTWNEYIEKLKNNEIDIMLNISKTSEREKYFTFTSEYSNSFDTIFVRKNENNFKTLSDFNGKTLAVVKGFYEESLLQKYYPQINLLSVENSIEALKKVAFGKVDGAVDNFAVGNYFIENSHITNLKPAFEIEDSRFNLKMHIATNKNNQILNDILEKGKSLITEDELNNLNKKWQNNNELLSNKKLYSVYLEKEERDYLNNKKIITMCVDPSWEPFEKIDRDGKHTGIAADIIKLISSKLDIKIELIPTKTWEDSLELSKNNKCDILSFLNETPKRKEWLNFTKPIFNDPNVIIGRSDTAEIKNLSKIKASIALPRGTAMYERFEKDFPNLMIIPVNSEDEAFEYVAEKKADLTLRSMIITAHTIKEKGLFNLKILAQPENYENQLRIGVIKNESILVDILNKGISEITPEEMEIIVNKWVAIKYEKNIDYTYFWILLIITSIIIILFLYRQYLLKHTNKYLKEEIIKRTQELEELNKNLEIRISKEVEKNRLIQEKLFKTDKLASMGEMISNIAHQWRQPLSIISTIATGIKLQKEFNNLTDDILIKDMDLINKNAQYLSETINDFRNFIKGDRKLQTFNLSETIYNFINIIDASIKSNNINLVLDLDKKIVIDGYPNELIQCLINIFNNSKDALLENNINKYLIFLSTKKENDVIYIKIKDNAGGIPEDIITKIYDPYFTTKHQSQGTGLGLHMTYKLVTEGLQGKIEAKNVEYSYENEKQKGVEFTIEI